MNILITGAAGFVGRNLAEALGAIRDGRDTTHPALSVGELYLYDLDTPSEVLREACRSADYVFHLAGVNRPKDESEFHSGNFGFTSELLSELRSAGNKCPIMLSSSIQASRDNPYGNSKRAGEELLFAYGRDEGVDVHIYRFPNLFGKWCRPNYNSAVATFCHNIARDLPITVNDPSVMLTLVYIDDLIEEMLAAASGKPTRGEDGFCRVPTEHTVLLGDIVELIRSFRQSREDRSVPNMADPFVRKLWATYLSYLPPEGGFAYPLKMNVDARGSFTEILRTKERGQFSVNISRPGITKGNHWHHTKNEKFLVVSGRGVIRFRRVGDERVYEYPVSGEELTVIDIPVGYTHSIENLGDTDLVTFMWASECFDPTKPDTFYLEV